LPDITDILAGKPIAGARLIRRIEDNDPGALPLVKALYPHTGNAFIMGITGPPGVGKSTLIDCLITEFRSRGRSVAVIAVDPTSPISGGAVLGDRARMQRHAADKRVFIRSMASRGHQGGLARAVKGTCIVLDAMGFDLIIIETLGAGQGQVDIAGLAHSIGVVTIPGTGDGLQAVKAGILEIGDIFIVNKSDRPGAEAAAAQLSAMIISGRPAKKNRHRKVLKTTAREGLGIQELADTFLSHLNFMDQNHGMAKKRREIDQSSFQSLLRDLAMEKIQAVMETSEAVRIAMEEIEKQTTDPLSAAQAVADTLRVVESGPQMK
jgi:LAO/AO transport system kinase